MTRLPETAVCMACGRPYLVAQGHACAGTRTGSATRTGRLGVFSTGRPSDHPNSELEKSP